MNKQFAERLSEIQENLNAPKNQYNSFGKYKYRSCEDILESVKPLLKGLFLSISDEIVLTGNRYYVRATATITDGENSHSASAMAREEESKKGMDAAQVTGATSSYARKYCLNGLFGIDDNKDADTDEHKQQQSASLPEKQPSHSPDIILKEFTESATNSKTPEELKRHFSEAWLLLKGTPQQATAKDVYDIRKSELEGVPA